MFTANTKLEVNSLDFNNIKSNIKNFVKTKTEFADYDFEGSTLNYLIDILAYNTYLNSFYTNMAVNETFLDTAQIRANVVSNAKELGYVPRSMKSAEAQIILTFTPQNSPSQIVIPAGTKFTAKKDGISYIFSTKSGYTVTPSGGLYSKTVSIYEGTRLNQTYNYDTKKRFYEILEPNVDLSTLIVGVRNSASSTDITYYTAVDDLVNVTGESTVYYIQENSDGRYEIYFGDGILGRSLLPGNVITFTYYACSGEAANDIATFTLVGNAGYNLDNPTQTYQASIRTSQKSFNGSSKEGIDSIRFNASNFYGSQNRLVTSTDYENFVYAKYPFVESVNVWGGEEHVPPVYGRVVLSVKPFGGFALQQLTKDSMVKDMKKRSVMAVEPMIIDPIFTFIRPTILVTYDSRRTIKTSDEIYNSIQDEVTNFENTSLSSFEKSFYYSEFIGSIDSADNSILGNDTEILLEKRIVPIYNSTISYQLRFFTAIHHPYDGFLGAVSSSGFKTNTTTETLYIEDNGLGSLRSYYFESDNVKRIYKRNIGTVDYGTGEINLDAMYITDLEGDDEELQIFIDPVERNYEQTRNQILLLSNPNLQIRDTNTKQIVKSGILEVNGNYTPIPSTNVNQPIIV